MRGVLVLSALLTVVFADARAQDTAGDEAEGAPALSWMTMVASDDYSSGLSNSDHNGYVEGRLTAAFDIWRLTAQGWTDGAGEGQTLKLLAGVEPALGDWQFDFSVARAVSTTFDDQGRWILDGNVTYPFAADIEGNAGVTYRLFDHDVDYAELYASLTLPLNDAAEMTASLDWEPDFDRQGSHMVEGTVELSYALDERISLAGELGYAWFDTPADDLASYAYWSAGVTFSLNDVVDFDLRYYGNSLTAAGCATQSDSRCDGALMASLTWSGERSVGKNR